MKQYATYRKAHYRYSIEATLEAGIVLHGHEVKAIRTGKVSLEGARVIVRGGEGWLIGASIAPYQQPNTPSSYDPQRPRKLLLHKRELSRIAAAEATKGLTVIPISLYDKAGKIKVSIAIARGKKKADKREVIRRRDMERAAARDLQRTVRF